jgi:hypothetical protein
MSDEETCCECGRALPWLSSKRSELGKVTCGVCTLVRIGVYGDKVEWERIPDDPFTQVAKAFHETVLPRRNADSSCTVRKIDGVSYSIEVTESGKCRSRMLGRIEQRLRHRGFSEDEIKEIVDDD